MTANERKLYDRMSGCAFCKHWGACKNQCGRGKRENKTVSKESGSAFRRAVQA